MELVDDSSIVMIYRFPYCATCRLCARAESTWWVVSIGMTNKMQYLRCSWALSDDSVHNVVSFLKVYESLR